MHAGTGELVASAIVKAAQDTGMPEGVFSNLNSAGIEVGTKLVLAPEVKAVGFTGSIAGGRALYNLAASREEPIPVFAEMGSINPVILLPEALDEELQDLVDTYAKSITLGTGQFCTNPGLLIGMQGPELDAFIGQLGDAIVQIEPSCMLHPNIIGAYERNKTVSKSEPELLVVQEFSGDVAPNFARQAVARVSGEVFLKNTNLHHEVFGPFSMVVECQTRAEMESIVAQLEGQLTGTVIAHGNDSTNFEEVIEALKNRVGRIIFNGVPTGVEVTAAMLHGGPYPASTDSRFTAVGIHSIKRWVRPFSYQNWPDQLLPDALKNENPLNISRMVNGEWTTSKINQA